MVSYQCSIVTLSLKCTVFEIFDFKYAVTLKTGLGSVKVIQNVTIQLNVHDFLLTYNSNHGPISYRFRDRRWFHSKIAKFSHLACILCPRWTGSPWNFGTNIGGKILEWWRYRVVKLDLFHNSCATDHCLNHLYSANWKPAGSVQLRHRSHNFALPTIHLEFNKRHFIARVLFDYVWCVSHVCFIRLP